MSGNIIPHVVLVNKTTGKTISKFSVLPYGKPEDWERVTKGFTIAWPDGTTGTGRVPFETEAEAAAYLAKVPAGFTGFNSY